MALPLKKERIEGENLTTADLAKGARAEERVEETAGPKPVSSEKFVGDRKVLNTEQRNANAEPNATPLFPENEMGELRQRWSDIQTAFVDEPRRAVEQADGLVASAMKRLAEVFADERGNLEKQWDRGDNVSTEDLRIAFQRYRTFFHRLLSI
jgi:hypothetical protein